MRLTVRGCSRTVARSDSWDYFTVVARFSAMGYSATLARYWLPDCWIVKARSAAEDCLHGMAR